MPMSVKTFAQVDEAARALAASRSARYLGGGTLIMRAVNYGDQSFDTIIRTTDPRLKQIAQQGDMLVIGAGITMSEVIANRETAFLAPVARTVGGPAIRNMATVGGNLFAASPYGDFTAALLALDARVVPAGGQPISLDEFLNARERNAGLVIVSVQIPRLRDVNAFRYVKVSRVKPKGIAVMSIAAVLPMQAGRLANARVAYGAMGPRPLRALAVERALEGRSLDEAGIAQALAVATEGVDPPSDPIASDWYRRQIAPVHLKRLLLGQRR
ncbi:oxidoreductase [Metarhizobium album]|uniref:Oxidoreductase n=1 Tax=Metarhizobium album TaxID=2182425 RepID=A0A2U2DIU3_9HYPH|nr:FAD binding domain-containing protein [Rhizobium album]PWE53227.1 oxidoreductase [Rhizobium album]